MYNEFTSIESQKWFKILPMLIEKYNTKHSTIDMTPVQAEENPSFVI